MNIKKLFLKQKPLVEYLGNMTHSEQFHQCVSYAYASMMQSNLRSDEIIGANKLIQELEHLTTPEDDDATGAIATGLEHDLDTIRKQSTETTPA